MNKLRSRPALIPYLFVGILILVLPNSACMPVAQQMDQVPSKIPENEEQSSRSIDELGGTQVLTKQPEEQTGAKTEQDPDPMDEMEGAQVLTMPPDDETVAETEMVPATSDGKYIAFICGQVNEDVTETLYNLAIINQDGSDFQILLEDSPSEGGPGYGPFWSPQGDWLVFEFRSIIYLYNQHRLGEPVELNYGVWPSWAPDGERIAYRSAYRDGGIEIANVEGQVIKNLPITLDEYSVVHLPKWSPNGKLIAYTTSEYPNGTDQGIVYNLNVIDVDTGKSRRLTDFPIKTFISTPLSWSPDSKKIVFSYNNPENPGVNLMVISADGSQQVDFGPGIHPYWSPDGSEILFRMDADLWTVRPDGSHRTQIVDKAVNGTWSPNGEKVIYTYGDIKIADRNGRLENTIAEGLCSNFISPPAWQP